MNTLSGSHLTKQIPNRSPPCQPFTRTRFSKQRDLDDKRTAGFQALLHLLCTLPVARRPRWIFLENVAGFIGSRGHALLRQQLRIAEFQWKEYVLSPTDVGIPNQRTRYYLLAERESHRFTSREDELHRQAPFRKMYRDEPPHGATPGKERSASIPQTASRRLVRRYPKCICGPSSTLLYIQQPTPNDGRST